MPSDGSPGDLERKLKIVVDKQEIHDALMRYSRGIDRGDTALVLSVFHPDATDNHSGVVERADERFPRTRAQAKSKGTSHNINNVLIQVDGDVAHSEAYFVAWHRFEHEGRELDWLLGGRYVDRFERRNGEWRIAHRTVVCDWDRFDDVGPRPTGLAISNFIDGAVRGVRSRDDHSYHELSF